MKLPACLKSVERRIVPDLRNSPRRHASFRLWELKSPAKHEKCKSLLSIGSSFPNLQTFGAQTSQKPRLQNLPVKRQLPTAGCP